MNSHADQFVFSKLPLLFLLALTILGAAQTAAAAVLNVPSTEFPTVQSAVNAAAPGDTIVLQAGTTFAESVNLKYKTGDEYITIQSSAMHLLPPDGHRVNPSFAAQMPRIVPPGYGEAAFYTEITAAGASHHYRLVGLEIAQTNPNQMTYNLVSFGGGDRDQNSLDKVAHHFVVDRCFIHGHENGEIRRGIGLNSAHTKIVNSYISEIHQVGYDTQAIGGWNGPGDYQIVNNYLEAAGENVMFGGADPWIPDLVPSDIEIRHNYIAKLMAWRDREPDWTVKNLLELKNARRVTIDRNVFENTWGFAYGAAQNGGAITFTVRNQDGTAPWSTIEDVKFTNNIVRRAGSGVSILGTDDTFVSQTMKNVLIKNNLFEKLGDAEFGGTGNVVGFSNTRDYSTGAQNVVIANNTALHTGMSISGEDYTRLAGLRFENNICKDHVLKSGFAGVEALNRMAGSTWAFSGNAFTIAGSYDYWSTQYPNSGTNTNFYLRSYNAVGFVDKTNGNYRLAPTSLYRNRATDGKDVGVDYAGLNTALATSDFDSDGKTDLVVWRPSNGVWYVAASADDSVRYFHFGTAGDVPVAGDYDGDGQTDYAVFRPSNGVWYVWQSSTSRMRAEQFGLAGDVPVPADYDADGKTDFAVYRADQSTDNKGFWFVKQSSTDSMIVRQWGVTGDKPIVGDFDGDGRADTTIFRSSSRVWFVGGSFDNSYQAFQFGLSGDVPVAGDYNGDGRLDVAVWRPSNGFWYARRADGNFNAFQFGANGDKPTPGDYDADGKIDFAVFRPSNGVWYLQGSSIGFKAKQFGVNGDLPTTAAAMPQQSEQFSTAATKIQVGAANLKRKN